MGGSNQEGPVSAITGENHHCPECLHRVTGEDLHHHDHLQIGLSACKTWGGLAYKQYEHTYNESDDVFLDQ